MAYDRKLDEKLAEEVAFEDDRTQLTVRVMSYDGGEPKLQLSRKWNAEREQGGDPAWIFRKVGRLTIAELEAVVKCMEKHAALFYGADEPPADLVQADADPT